MTNRRNLTWTIVSLLVPCALGLVLLRSKPVIAQSAAGRPRSSKSIPFWPQPLPNHWVTGSTIGLSVDPQDRVWTIHRPNTVEDNFKAADIKVGDARGADDEALPGRAGEKAATDTFIGKCCKVAPPVLVYDQAGSLVKSWGGPGKGYDWPDSNHGITVDHEGNVWLAGNGDKDTQLLKFDGAGKFLFQIGKHGVHNGSNDIGNFWKPTKVFVDASANEVYVADGYGNRRVIVFDAASGKYKRHWGAYGSQPSDEAVPPYSPNGPRSKQFNTVHCAMVSNDGFVYVCDRVNDRIQVFRKDGTFVKEAVVDAHTFRSGSLWDMTFSTRPAADVYLCRQRCRSEDQHPAAQHARSADVVWRRRPRAGAVLRRPQPCHRFPRESLRRGNLHRCTRSAIHLQGHRARDQGGAGRGVAQGWALSHVRPIAGGAILTDTSADREEVRPMVRIVLFVGLTLACGDGVALAAQPAATPRRPVPPVSLTDYTLTNWSEEQGPFPFGIYAIAQDREGYLWLGARTGLVRFDGSEFVLWKGRPRLPDERIAAILAARDGSLWVGFGTVGGVAQIVDGTARQLHGEGRTRATATSMPSSRIPAAPSGWPAMAAWPDSTANAGGWSAKTRDCLAGQCLGLWRDSRGRLWVGTTTGLYRRAAEERTFTLIERWERRRRRGRSSGHDLGQRPRRGISHRRPPALEQTHGRLDLPRRRPRIVD